MSERRQLWLLEIIGIDQRQCQPGRPDAWPARKAHDYREDELAHDMAFGFRDPEHLIALSLLDRGATAPAARTFTSGACAVFLNRVGAGFPEK